ncbi:hypothetical protein JCM10207_000508 [Rhodosporidiobolus poonsookiae]
MPHAKLTIQDCAIPASAPLEEIMDLLAVRGGIVLKDLVSQEDCDAMEKDLRPHLDRVAASKKGWEGSFFPSTTHKIGGLITKSSTYAHKVLAHPLLLQIARDILSVSNDLSFARPRKRSTALPNVNSTGILEIHPGSKAQELHRDDALYHNVLPKTDKWTKDREVSILCFVAGTRVTPQNGGTCFIPGSHMWGEFDELPGGDHPDLLKCEMERGDCFVMLCSTWHGGGTNSCEPGTPDSVRMLIQAGYVRGYLRQEEQQALALDPEVLKTYPREIQELAGWNISLPMCGWVDFGHPLNTLGYQIADSDDLFYDKDQ